MSLDSWAAVATIVGVVLPMLGGAVVWAWRIHRSVKITESRSVELINNHGSSLRDAVDRIELMQDSLTQAFIRHLEGHAAPKGVTK